MSHFPKIPMHLQNPDLFKASLAGSAITNSSIQETVPSASTHSQYRTPPDRVNGNEVFRRLPNGQVDMLAAVDTCLAALNQLKFKGPLNDIECRILCACFPEAMKEVVPEMDGHMAAAECRSRLRVSEEEIRDIAALTSMKLMEMHQWLLFGLKI